MPGYLHPLYAASLQEFGRPRYLPRCGGWILERPIPGSTERDGMGCYPLFCCQDWSGLAEDLEELSKDLITISLVADPFGRYTEAELADCFPDAFRAYKEAFVIDFEGRWENAISDDRKKKSSRAQKSLTIEICEHPIEYLDEWVALYEILCQKHKIQNIGRFSKDSFAGQLKVPGAILFKASHHDGTAGMTLWYVQDDIVYGHLAAFSDLGYKMRASYALDWYAIKHFSDKVRWLYFGGGAGLAIPMDDGLSNYKRGWCNQSRPLYFCGRVFNAAKYRALVPDRLAVTNNYFPAYRTPY